MAQNEAWFKRRLQFRMAGVDACGLSLSSFAPRKNALSRSERRLYSSPSSCYPRNPQSEPCPKRREKRPSTATFWHAGSTCSRGSNPSRAWLYDCTSRVQRRVAEESHSWHRGCSTFWPARIQGEHNYRDSSLITTGPRGKTYTNPKR